MGKMLRTIGLMSGTSLDGVDAAWLERKLTLYGLMPKNGVRSLKKIVAGRQLWNYDNLEPTEKKLIL